MDNPDLKRMIKKLHQGDRDAFHTIYEDLKIPVYTIIYRILYDRQAAEDVMQEIFIRLYKNPPSLQIKNPRAWIFQMARNLAIDYRRKKKDSEPISYQTESVNFSIENAVTAKMDVELALKRLSIEEREIVTLHLNGDLTFREISLVMDKPLGTVLWRYRKAIGKMRNILSGGV